MNAEEIQLKLFLKTTPRGEIVEAEIQWAFEHFWRNELCKISDADAVRTGSHRQRAE